MLGIAREFHNDSTRQTRISGSTDWAQKSCTISGTGTHTLKWRYVKDGSETSGYDCGWVDYVQWSGTTQNPLPTTWETITYGYDSAGRRIEKAYDGQTVCKYLYACPELAERDGSHIIAEYDGNNSLLHKYIYGPGVDQPICMIDVEHSSTAYYYHFDGLGSVIALTNSAGSVVNLYEYSVYGEVSASDPNHPNRFLFTGREFDKDTGLYYYRARYYNPYIGRFLQTDPANDGMNAYVYCANNPLNSIDPSGAAHVPFEWAGFEKGGLFWWYDLDNKYHKKTFASIDDWLTWAKAGNFMPDSWVTGDANTPPAVGWMVALRWHEDNVAPIDAMELFWELRAVMFLDWRGTVFSFIDEIEQKAPVFKLMINRTTQQTDKFKDYYRQVVTWNTTLGHIGGVGEGFPNWHTFHPLVALAHELGHAADDYWTGLAIGEPFAIEIENGVRWSLWTYFDANIWPRPGNGYIGIGGGGLGVPDLGPTLEEAWGAWDTWNR